jgi:hypothetical protein
MGSLITLIEAARRSGVERRLENFGDDPLLTVACVALIGVCLMWIVMSRLISRNVKKAVRRGVVKIDTVKPPRDIWGAPP